jgi:hypothetical protein
LSGHFVLRYLTKWQKPARGVSWSADKALGEALLGVLVENEMNGHALHKFADKAYPRGSVCRTSLHIRFPEALVPNVLPIR